METAACMIEANEPVYTLDILKTMRNQRAMLIQTFVSFFLIFYNKKNKFLYKNVNKINLKKNFIIINIFLKLRIV